MTDHNFKITLSAGHLAALRAYAVNQGIIATQHGEIEAHGVKVAYAIDDNYHPKDGSSEVSFTILHKPLFITESMVEEKIESFIESFPEVEPPTPVEIVVGQEQAQEQSAAPEDAQPESPEAPSLTSEGGAGPTVDPDDPNLEGKN